MRNQIKIIAHRSGPSLFPEQTVASAKLAMENKADWIEIDLRLSKDLIPIVSHDSDTQRVFGTYAKTAELTAEQYSALTHRDNPAYHGHKFSDYTESKISPLLLHIKEYAAIAPVCRLLKQYGYDRNQVVFGVSTVEMVNEVRLNFPSAQILAFMPNPACLPEFENANVDYIRFWEQWLNSTPIHATQKPVWIMTDGVEVGVTTQEKLQTLMQMPIDGILINDITKIYSLPEMRK